MPLRARVGRHAKTGAQCQNWVEDQLIVIMLLNFIPAADGGAEASLTTNRVVGGISSDALYNAILRFQKQHFPAQQSGFVEPGGAVLARMEMLASQPTAAPKSVGQWGEFQSGSVQRALYEALKDDPHLSQVKVVDILHSTLSNGTVSTSELADLQMVAEKSKSILPRSKRMLELFVKEAKSKITARGPYALSSSQIYASDSVCDFLKRSGRGFWPNLDRDDVGVGMLLRIAKPGLLQQGGASLCGPAAFLFSLLRDRPGQYTRFAIDLYEKGEATMDNRSIEPSSAVRHSRPSGNVDPVDWLTMAGLRDSDNWWFNYDTADRTFSGATTPMEMAWWFTRARYSNVKEDANFFRHQRDTDNMDEASRLVTAGYRVVLLIDEQMIETQHQAESGGLSDRHWVVLLSRIDQLGGNVKMKIFTYGDGDYQVPQKGVLPLDDFLMNYYGYVAAKP